MHVVFTMPSLGQRLLWLVADDDNDFDLNGIYSYLRSDQDDDIPFTLGFRSCFNSFCVTKKWCDTNHVDLIVIKLYELCHHRIDVVWLVKDDDNGDDFDSVDIDSYLRSYEDDDISYIRG